MSDEIDAGPPDLPPGCEPLFDARETDVLQDAVARLLADYLMHPDTAPHEDGRFDALVNAGRKLGMEL